MQIPNPVLINECRERGEPMVVYAPFGNELIAFYESARTVLVCLMCGSTEMRTQAGSGLQGDAQDSLTVTGAEG